MSKILTTGGAGFIGYFLAERLSKDQNNSITIVDNLSRGKMDAEMQKLLARRNVFFVMGDLNNREFLSQLDQDYEYVYHLAAVIGVENVMRNPDKVLYTNVISLLHVFELLKHFKNLKKIFFSSTSEVYAGTLKHFGIDIPTDENVLLTIEDITAL
nr:NAD-dependent epimerase/dehydratase family protein [Bacteroidota bacterium]